MFSNEEIAGSRLILGFDGTTLNNDLKFIIGKLKVCGIILFTRNIKNPAQIKKLCLDAQNYAKTCGTYPLFIAIDQEGGIVARLKKPNFAEFIGAPFLKTKKEIKKTTQFSINQLKKIGINMNMSPVLDIANKEIDSIMRDRAFSSKPKDVAKYGIEVIKTYKKNNIFSVAKHFPGIGRSTIDSHFHLPEINIEYKTLDDFELLPFKAVIKEKAPAIMLSHLLYTKLDKKYPASMSYTIAKKILREKLRYEGLIITDDLDMKAIKFDIKIIIEQILKSDIDIALICHKTKKRERAFLELLKHISANKLLKEKSKKTFYRIKKAKKLII